MINIQIHKIEIIITPSKIIFNNQLFKITKLPSYYIIKNYEIKTFDGLIENIVLNSQHPNANPENGELCIPDYLKKHKITKQSKFIIYNILNCYNLDDCYFTPWDEISYKKEEI